MTDPNLSHARSEPDSIVVESDGTAVQIIEQPAANSTPEPIALLRRIRAHVAVRSQSANSAVLIAQGFNVAGIALARAYAHYGRRVIVIGERRDLAPAVQTACVKAIVMPMPLGRTDERNRLIDSLERSFPALDTLVFAGDAGDIGARNYISERDLIDDATTVMLGPTALSEWYLSGCRVTPHRNVLASISPGPIRANAGKHDALAAAMARSLHDYVRALGQVLDARRVEVLALPGPGGSRVAPSTLTTAGFDVRRFDRWGLQMVRRIENARTHGNSLMRWLGTARPSPD
jgi:short-subunit dehydrogenase involved in D-alanine esterification of teichoic acids